MATHSYILILIRENPMDRGARQLQSVGSQSLTRLKQLSTPGVQGPHTPSLLPGHPCASLPGALGVSHAALAVSGQILSHTWALS